MSFKDLDLKTLRKVVIIIWSALLIINLIFVLHVPTYFGWFTVGFFVGGILIMLMNNPHMNWSENFIKRLFNTIKDYQDIITRLSESSKKMKGGKKKK